MGKHHKVTDEALAVAIRDSISFREVLRKLGIKQAGGSQSHYTSRARALGLDLSHFLGQAANRGKVSRLKKTSEHYLVKRESGARQDSKRLTRSLLEIGRKHECEQCGQGPEWRGNPLTLDVDHINEDWLDDRADNLRFLCPNCHSQYSRGLRK
jgi:hypothetical protein